MRRFTFRLQKLLEVRETVRDECRARLAEAYLAERQLAAQQAALSGELSELAATRRMKQKGTIDVRQLAQASRFESALREDLQALEARARILADEIHECREALAAADRDVRLLERLRERKLAYHDKCEAAYEAKDLDDRVRPSLGQL